MCVLERRARPVQICRLIGALDSNERIVRMGSLVRMHRCDVY